MAVTPFPHAIQYHPYNVDSNDDNARYIPYTNITGAMLGLNDIHMVHVC